MQDCKKKGEREGEAMNESLRKAWEEGWRSWGMGLGTHSGCSVQTSFNFGAVVRFLQIYGHPRWLI